MTDLESQNALHIVVEMLGRIAAKTRSNADDALVAVLRLNEARLAAVLRDLMNDPQQPPSSERIQAALANAGIQT